MERFIQILIYFHAGLGAIALLCGAISLATKKGGWFHQNAGKWFYFSMLASGIVAVIIAAIPSNNSPILLVIGIFSIYLLLAGFRSIKILRSREQKAKMIDKTISWGMIISAFYMFYVAYNLFHAGHFMGYVVLVFAGIGFGNAIGDFFLFKKEFNYNKWLSNHLGKMTGGYIAAATAFLVVNQWLPGIIGWLAPTVLGSIYITYWNIKIFRKAKA